MSSHLNLTTPCCGTAPLVCTQSDGSYEGEENVGFECLTCYNEWNMDGVLTNTTKNFTLEGHDWSVMGDPDELDGKIKRLRELVAEHGFAEGTRMARSY